MYNINEEICLISGKTSKCEYTLKFMGAKLWGQQMKSEFLKTFSPGFETTIFLEMSTNESSVEHKFQLCLKFILSAAIQCCSTKVSK